MESWDQAVNGSPQQQTEELLQSPGAGQPVPPSLALIPIPATHPKVNGRTSVMGPQPLFWGKNETFQGTYQEVSLEQEPSPDETS